MTIFSMRQAIRIRVLMQLIQLVQLRPMYQVHMSFLSYAAEHYCRRFLCFSSVEIYGESRKDVDKFGESYLGYIDCNTVRAGYPESKRLSESLCNAFAAQKEQDFCNRAFLKGVWNKPWG